MSPTGAARCGLALAVAAAAMALPAVPEAHAAEVLVVGDSLEIGTGPYLRQELGGVPVTIDAVKGRPSSDGVSVLGARLGPADEVVVFDLGVNDDPAQPQALATDLGAARAIAGDRCMVVATLSRPPYNGVSVDGLNQAVRGFAAASSPTELVDWRAAALANPGLLNADGVHPTAAGYALRGRLVAQGVQSCLGSGTAPESENPAAPSPGPVAPRPRPEPRIDWAALGLPSPSALLDALVGAAREALAAAVAPLQRLNAPPGPAPVID